MKIFKSSLIAVAMMASTGSANATFFYYFGAEQANYNNNLPNTTVSIAIAESAWLAKANAVASTNYGASAPAIADFVTNAANVNAAVSATGSGITNTSQNINLSHSTIDGTTINDHSNTSGEATFAAVGSAPGFTITTSEVIGGNYSGVFFNDIPAGKSAATADGWENKLSIGKFNGFPSGSGFDTQDYDDDDFALEITGGESLYAFAFHMINNKKSNADEMIITSDSGAKTTIGDSTNTATNGLTGLVDGDALPGYNSGNGVIDGVEFVHESFIGIVTDSVADIFSLLNFDEGAGVNDIGIFDLRFGVAPAPVPIPAAVWLFISGLMAVFGFSRKRSK